MDIEGDSWYRPKESSVSDLFFYGKQVGNTHVVFTFGDGYIGAKSDVDCSGLIDSMFQQTLYNKPAERPVPPKPPLPQQYTYVDSSYNDTLFGLGMRFILPLLALASLAIGIWFFTR